jgi:uncharacterized damage-inducible protein DinB
MINVPTASLLACYKGWADRLTFDAVAALPAGEAGRERPTLFKSIVGTLNHNYVVDLIWKANLEEKPHGFSTRNAILHAELGDLWAAQRSLNEWLLAWSEQQTDESLAGITSFQFVSGEAGSATRGEVLLHMVNHSTYHRGWISEIFFQLPAKPPTTDLSVFMVERYRELPTAIAPGAAQRALVRSCG